MSTTEVRLTADVPPLTEEPRVMVVRCGKTIVDVREYGHTGSGNWAAWKYSGNVIGDGGKSGHSFETAMADARTYVALEERRRLLHEALRDHLAGEAADA